MRVLVILLALGPALVLAVARRAGPQPLAPFVGLCVATSLLLALWPVASTRRAREALQRWLGQQLDQRAGGLTSIEGVLVLLRPQGADEPTTVMTASAGRPLYAYSVAGEGVLRERLRGYTAEEPMTVAAVRTNEGLVELGSPLVVVMGSREEGALWAGEASGRRWVGEGERVQAWGRLEQETQGEGAFREAVPVRRTLCAALENASGERVVAVVSRERPRMSWTIYKLNAVCLFALSALALTWVEAGTTREPAHGAQGRGGPGLE